jgi:hypothetical protein
VCIHQLESHGENKNKIIWIEAQSYITAAPTIRSNDFKKYTYLLIYMVGVALGYYSIITPTRLKMHPSKYESP